MGLGLASKRQIGQNARFQRENTMRVGRRPTKLGAPLPTVKCVEDELPYSSKNLPIKKFLFEALAAFSSMTKLRTSARFLHGLSH